MTAYRWVVENGMGHSEAVASTLIGAPDQSWCNTYVELYSHDLPFSSIWFEGVNSPNDLLGFCMDDMTITYVPEPSSLLALCAGIAAMGALIRRRRN